MSTRDQLGRALFGLALRNFKVVGHAKKLRAQAGETLIALHLPRTRQPTRGAAAGTQAALASIVPRGEAVALKHPMSRFGEDMNELLKASRSRPRVSAAKEAQDARILSIQKMAHDPKVWNLGLRDDQASTLGSLLGHLWGSAFHGGARGASQSAAQQLSAGLKDVWDQALPPGKSLEQALWGAWQKLQQARREDPDLNAGEFLRDKLFDPWRSRFMNRLYKEDDLRRRLLDQTGLKVDKPLPDASPRFVLELKAGELPFQVGLDIDHAGQRLAEAVEKALAAPSDAAAAALLRPIVQGSSLQLALPAENRVVFEFLRRRNRVAEQMRSSSARLMSRDDQAELMASLERDLQAIDAWQPWSP